MHPERITVWSGLWAGGIIGPYFFKDTANRKVNVNGERYHEMISNSFFAQDARAWFAWYVASTRRATCNTALVAVDLLRSKFGKHFFYLDYFLWSYVKAHVYTDKPISIEALEDDIEAFIREMLAEMLKRECQNWTKRMDYLRGNRGQHLHEIIFRHLNYMDRTTDSNKDFMHFSEFYVFNFEKLSSSS